MAVKKLPNPIDKYVGSRVRMQRMILSISQTKLAEAIGITFQQVQKYEQGANRISASRLQQIANILQVPVTFFFEGTPGQRKADASAPSPTYVSEFLATSDGLALTRAFTRLANAKLRRSIVALVAGIAGDK